MAKAITYTEPQARRVRKLMVSSEFQTEKNQPDLKKIAYAVGCSVEAAEYVINEAHARREGDEGSTKGKAGGKTDGKTQGKTGGKTDDDGNPLS